MALADLIASPHPDGNQIDLQWTLPVEEDYAGVRVVRRAGTYPVSPDDGVNVAEGNGLVSATDVGLKAEEVYYYSVFPYVGAPPVFLIDKKNRVSAMATGPQEFAGYMYSLLPAIYHRYDRVTLALSRFLQLPGGQLDQLHSVAKAAWELKNIDRVNGDLLPLLSQWIGWKTDNKLEFQAQREEIRRAPAIYKTVGLMPTVKATIKRISGWESQSKEFVHNIFVSNRPEKLNIWSIVRDNGGIWSTVPELVSLDYAFEGRPSSVVDNNNIRWLFYQTQRKNRWEIWSKTSPTYPLSISLLEQLIDGAASTDLLQAVNETELSLSPTATITTITPDQVWGISDGANDYVVEHFDQQLKIYFLDGEINDFSASLPVIVQRDLICKYPSAAQQGANLWLFWSVFDEEHNQWRIQYRLRTDANWSEIGPAEPDPSVDLDRNPFVVGGLYDSSSHRRNPFAAIDDAGLLWLFWIEKINNMWQLRYNRHDGVNWGEALTFPLVGGGDARVFSDLQVTIDITTPRILVTWSRQMNISTPGMQRWQVAYRIKNDTNFDELNWSTVNTLPKHTIDDNHHDREAYAVFSAGQPEVFWSSDREDSGWSVWCAVLTDVVANTWDQVQRITPAELSQRTPLPIALDSELLLLFRSNRHISYQSDTYGSLLNHDLRYSGATTVNTRHAQKNHLREIDPLMDSQCYTYDTGTDEQRDDSNQIARDTIGIFLQTLSYSEEEIATQISRLRPVLAEFMPVTDRAVLLPLMDVHSELVYGYSLPSSADAHFISETYDDQFVDVIVESVLVGDEDFTDSLGDPL